MAIGRMEVIRKSGVYAPASGAAIGTWGGGFGTWSEGKTVSSGGGAGSTVITLNAVTGLAVGDFIVFEKEVAARQEARRITAIGTPGANDVTVDAALAYTHAAASPVDRVDVAGIYIDSGVFVGANAIKGFELDLSDIVSAVLTMDVTAVAGTTPTAQPVLDYLGPDGVWYTLWVGTVSAAVLANTQLMWVLDGDPQATLPTLTSTQILRGTGRLAGGSGGLYRLRNVLGGTTPSLTYSAVIGGRPN